MASSKLSTVLESLQVVSNKVLQYEDKLLQDEALKLIPIEKITIETQQHMQQVQEEIKKKNLSEEKSYDSEIFILYLMKWFRTDFFSWVDKLDCEKCSGVTESRGQLLHPIKRERIELFYCPACDHNTEFHRYNSVEDLMRTRRGRCGEWANCFSFFCRALGYETRLIHDFTDHAWTEIYSPLQKRWIHCDPCEKIDEPLLYEKGWNKKLTYILAAACDHVQDVTWRYTADFKATRGRRNLVSEVDLIHAILRINKSRQVSLPPARRRELLERQVAELAQFLTQPAVSEGHEFGGRMSGSVAWRLARGEISNEEAERLEREAKPHLFQLKDEDFVDRTFTLEYCPVADGYYKNRTIDSDAAPIFSQWRSGVFECENVFRKVEHDWQMVYLSRKENSATGFIRWKLDFSSLSHPVDTVELRVVNGVYENGQVTWTLSSDTQKESQVANSPSKDNIQVLELNTKLSGSSHLIIECQFELGRGSYAWQHAQAFRTSTKKRNPQPPAPLRIVVRMQP